MMNQAAKYAKSPMPVKMISRMVTMRTRLGFHP
jgi:hypothetical protein